MPELEQPLPPHELVEDVIPLAAEEAPPSIPKDQSPNLMIEDVLGDLSPRGGES